MDGMDTTAEIGGGDIERRKGSGMKTESTAELAKKGHLSCASVTRYVSKFWL